MTNGSARRWAWLPAWLSSILCVVFIVYRAPAPAAQGGPLSRVSDELLVKFRPEVSADRRATHLARVGATVRRHLDALDIEHVRVAAGQADNAIRVLAANPDVAAVQPNFIRHAIAAPPNDPYWLDGSLWGLLKINAQPAWTTYSSSAHDVVVGVIDTGINYSHPDLTANVWTNAGEIPGNGIDDDGDGYADDVHGIDTVNHDSDPLDDQGHGTHTSGTIGASGNNGVGVTGVAWSPQILACKFLDATGSGNDANAVTCFNYFVDLKLHHGINIRVINNSWGAPRDLTQPFPTVMKSAIDSAGSAGIISVFAAGNSNTNIDTTPFDPASFTSPSIVTVAASDSSDARASFSNYGATSVDLAAPGVNILSTYGSGYAYESGTSMAAPHVSGTLALMASTNPSLSVDALKARLLASVDPVAGWSGITATAGRLNVFQALARAFDNLPPTVSLTAPAAGVLGTAPVTVTVAATASDSDGTVAQVAFYAGATLIGTDTTAPYSVTWSGVAAGTYSLTAVATDSFGATTTSAPVTVTVSGAASTLPSGWTDADIGATGAAGAASYSGGTFSLTGAGADVWGSADALHYAWRSMTGDGTMVARVASIQNVNAWTKAGVMIRNSTSPSAAQAFMLVAASSSKGAPFQRRVSDGNTSVSTAGPFVTAPYWVKVVRAGGVITGYASPDGSTWTAVGSDTFTIGSTILIGLGVSSHVAGTNATATFDNVTVTPASLVPPTVSLTSPANGATYTAPATIPLSATASDSSGTITQVQFFADSTLIGTATSSPYSLTWSSVPAGTYSLTAVATDNNGQTATSSAGTVTVNAAAANHPPTVSITSPANAATFAAPASITITASASDSDGSVAKVDFYSGTTLLGTVTPPPYSFTWNSVPAGTYTLTAIATDNAGATTSSPPVSVTVTAASTLPAGWSDGDIGATGATGSASYSGGTFTVTGAGADVWGSTDALHYAWRSLAGDGTIVARVVSVQNVNAWTKAGVMIRNSTSPSAAQAFMLVAASAAKGVPFQRRVADGNTSVSTAGPLVTAPYWVKLVRAGSVITGYASPDGSTWTAVGSDTLTIGSTVLIGLGVSSHVAGVNAIATFDNVTVTGGS